MTPNIQEYLPLRVDHFLKKIPSREARKKSPKLFPIVKFVQKYRFVLIQLHCFWTGLSHLWFWTNPNSDLGMIDKSVKHFKCQSRLQQTTFINIFSLFFREIRLDVLSDSSARQRIHMKSQALFSSKGKSKKLKCRLLHFLFDALKVNADVQILTKNVRPYMYQGVSGLKFSILPHRSVIWSWGFTLKSPPSSWLSRKLNL